MPERSNEKQFPIIARYAHKEDEHPDGWVFTLCGGHHGFNGYGILTKQMTESVRNDTQDT